MLGLKTVWFMSITSSKRIMYVSFKHFEVQGSLSFQANLKEIRRMFS
jgi:hypothetical protein